MSDWIVFGERLSHVMREYDISLRELSRRTGITLTTLHRYATCKRVPKATEILKCADALGVTCDYLLGLSDDPHLTGKGERVIGKGKWIEIAPEEGHEIYTVKCDQCGRYDFFETNYCGNCGADMREAERLEDG